MESKTKGNKLFQAGKTEEAIQAYSTGIDKVEEGKGSAEDKGCLHLLYANRSMAHLELALVDEALQDAELCIDTNPDFGKGYLRRALVLLDLFKNQDAVLDLDKAEELDPGLAPEGCEARRRAAGEVWVDNCYLKEHKRLKKKLGCDYVVIGEIEESDTKLDDLIKIEDTDRLPVGLPWFATDIVVLPLLKLSTTELGVNLYPATIEVSLVLFETFYGLERGRQVGKFGVNHPFHRLVFAQLKREYGPSHTCHIPKPVASTLGYDSNSMQCFLWHCVTQADKHQGTPTTLMFPGAPKWLEFDDAETQIFLDWIRWEREERGKEYRDVLQSLKPSLCRTAPKPIGEAPPFAMFAEHRQQLKDYRARLEQADHRCQGCGIDIKDPDPQECLCGAFYCSFLCHAEYKASHRTECEKTLHELQGPSLWTIWYWRLVLLGYYPFKNEVDPVAAWKSRNIEVDTTSGWNQELFFYQDLENALREETKASMIGLIGKPYANEVDRRRTQLGVESLGLESMQRCLKRYSTPILTDTPGRIRWRYACYKHDFPIFCADLPLLDTVDNQVAVIQFRMMAFTRARCAPGENSPAWHKLLKDLTNE